MKIYRYLFISVFLCAILSCGGNEQPEICNNNQDDNQNGQTDCNDSVCQNDPVCQPENCENQQDDDADNLLDCEDPECQNDPVCQPENCDNGIDDNANGQLDCNDAECQANPICLESGNCEDGIDNDNDGIVDCADTDCAKDIPCQSEICNNGVDDNGNGQLDCDDPDCEFDPICVEPGNCDDGIDNDQDGLVDCQDEECVSEEVCVPEICDNGSDDDGDGDFDCEDTECVSDSFCVELCQNAIVAGDPSVQTNDNTGAPNVSIGSCLLGGGAPDIVFEVIPTNTGVLHLSLISLSDADLGMFVQTICNDPSTELGCVEGFFKGESEFFLSVPATTGVPIFVFVSSFAFFDTGPFTLEIQSAPIVPEDCASNLDEDLDGLFDCDDSDCFNEQVCEAEICDNGIDEDLDGLIDCDDDECELDPFCTAQFCQNTILADVFSIQTNDNTGAPNISDGTCQAFGGSDVLFEVIPLVDGDLHFILTSDADLGVFVQTSCGDPASEIGCADSDFGPGAVETLTVPVIAGVPISVFVGGFAIGIGDEGPFTLEIQSVEPEICNNGFDDDLNGLFDCDDPACLGSVFCEAEICDNGIDEDLDGLIDCDDDECELDPFCTAQFCQNTILADVFSIQTNDNTGAPNISDASCQVSGGSDVIFEVTPPTDGNLVLTLTSDADLGVFVQTSCGDPVSEIGCADLGAGTAFVETLVVPVSAGVPTFVFVGGHSVNEEGPFTLEIQSIPFGPEICGNEIDDDGDLATDCIDRDCLGDAFCVDFCNNSINVAPSITVISGVDNSINFADGSCQLAQNGGGGTDALFQVISPISGTLTATLVASTKNLGLFVQTVCGDNTTEIACSENGLAGGIETVSVPITANIPLFVFVGAFTPADSISGQFTIELTLQ